jgi:hypothetical protein
MTRSNNQNEAKELSERPKEACKGLLDELTKT